MSDQKETPKEQSNEVVVENINNVALNEGEKARIIVVEQQDGTITISAKTQGPINVTYLTGMLEVAKNDVLNRDQQSMDPPKMVDVVLDAVDFEMDVNKQLEKQGKKPGDTISMPEPIARMRDLAKVEFGKVKK